MKLLNIEFAPLCIPLERRLQTLAAATSILTYMFGSFVAIGLTYYFIFHTKLRWFCILYLIWIFLIDTDVFKASKRRSEWVRNWVLWRYTQAYYPITLVKVSSQELDPKKNYLFSCFPHGILATGVSTSCSTNAVNIREHYPHHIAYGHTITLIFYVPFVRELAFWFGCLPVSQEALTYAMSKPEGGNISFLVVGGAEESLYCLPGIHKIILRTRKGFIKIALKTGCSLVPVYCFGEDEIYGQYQFKEGSLMKKFQTLFKKLTGVALIIIKGRGLFQYTFGLLPHRRPLTVVVGEPIDVQKTENPTQEQIDHLHKLFQTKLMELFDSQKKYYLKDHETAKLEIC